MPPAARCLMSSITVVAIAAHEAMRLRITMDGLSLTTVMKGVTQVCGSVSTLNVRSAHPIVLMKLTGGRQGVNLADTRYGRPFWL